MTWNKTVKDIKWYPIKTIIESCGHWSQLKLGTQLNVMKEHRDEIIEKGWGKDDIL